VEYEREPETTSATGKFEAALIESDKGKYVLRLYITGMTRRSQIALRNLEKVCAEHLGDRCELEVIDIYQQPNLAKSDQILAIPTLIKKLPLPVKRLIGDLSKEDRIILGLNLEPKPKQKKMKTGDGTEPKNE